MNTEIQTLEARLKQLEQDNTQIKQDNAQIKAQFRNERRRFRAQMGLAFCVVVGAIVISPANRSAIAQGYGVTLATLNTRNQCTTPTREFSGRL